MFTRPRHLRSRTARHQIRSGIALLVAGAFLVGAPALAGAEEADDAPQSHINITQTDAPNPGPCSPGSVGLTNSVKSTPESFTLTVKASSAPCDSIKATAVIYAMPGNGNAWPQKLVEKKDFIINSAGTTTIEFLKTCDAQQFDVVVGDTPQTIDVTGPWHGPLLFPFDTATAEQYWGCVENETTVPPETTPTTQTTIPTVNSVPETTVPVEVLGTSTVPAAVENQTDPGAEVLDSTAEPKELAFTGSDAGPATAVGVALLVLGAGMVLFSRRRRAEA